MKKPFSYIAFYDLDHTILSGNSATFLVEEARLRGVMTPKQYRHAVYLSIIYKLNIGNPSKMISRMLSWLSGIEEEAINELCRDVFTESLKGNIRTEILSTFEQHRAQNGGLVLLSSATAPICSPISEYLNMDDTVCTQLASEKGILTGTTEGKLVYGMEKKHRMESFCIENEYQPADAFYYGDSITDQYVMEAVGHPVAVAPDRRLLKLALHRNWTILVRDR